MFQKFIVFAAGNSMKGIRWHPLMIRWCLFLRHQSSKAYETLRQSGCVHLPSQRTLRDYSHCVRAGAGFSDDVDQQLLKSIKSSSSTDKLFILLLDEIHLKEDLVFNKQTGETISVILYCLYLALPQEKWLVLSI